MDELESTYVRGQHMDIHHLIGIGFGPSHIGLAVSLYEDYKEETEGKKITFFEAKNIFLFEKNRL